MLYLTLLFVVCRYPMGEIRANLNVPRGTATLTYNPSAAANLQFNPLVLSAALASISVTVSGLTGPILQAHIHGPSDSGSNSGVLVTLCNPCTLSNDNSTQTFANIQVPLQLLDQRLLYINLHTDSNPGGELRGQIVTVVRIPSFETSSIVGSPTPNFQNATDILSPNTNLPISFSVPLSVGQEPNVVLNYRATPQQEGSNSISPAGCTVVPNPQSMATFGITVNPLGQTSDTVIFSNITITGLSSNLTAAHIHGPCSFQPCNAGVVYTICNSNSPCPANVTIIPGFTVTTADFSTLSLLSGDAFFYLNIHTVNNPNGELRADLVVPRGSVTVSYTRAPVTTSSAIPGNPRIAVVPAIVTVSLTGLTGPVQAIHLHGLAGFGRNGGVLIPICTGPADCGLGSTLTTKTFSTANWPINIAASGSTYFNVHTGSNPAGEVRGQVVQQLKIPDPSSNRLGGTLTATFFTDSLCTVQPDATAARSLPVIGQNLIDPNLPIWAVSNPSVISFSSCNPLGSRLDSNGSTLTVYAQLFQCASQGAGAIFGTFSDSLCSIPFTPAELFPASALGQCFQIYPPTPNIAPSGLYARESCSSGDISLTIPVSAYQENAPLTLSFTGTPGQQMNPPMLACATASFNVTFDPSSSASSVAFSNITFSGNLTGPLTAAHIHGPCPNSVPCDAPVVYIICNALSCPTGTSPSINAFSVNTQQDVNSDNSNLVGLLSEILTGSNLYYVNFHTAM